jgi:hypothetical protein
MWGALTEMPLPALLRSANRGTQGDVLSAQPPAPLSATVNAPARPVDPDALLVRQHLAGDPKAFEQLFRRYQTPIFNLVTRMVRGEDAYDLTQDVFLKALRSLKTFRGDAKFSTWLFTIARHTCLNHIRHKAVHYRGQYRGAAGRPSGRRNRTGRPHDGCQSAL